VNGQRTRFLWVLAAQESGLDVDKIMGIVLRLSKEELISENIASGVNAPELWIDFQLVRL
jgi:hypothetical protein